MSRRLLRAPRVAIAVAILLVCVTQSGTGSAAADANLSTPVSASVTTSGSGSTAPPDSSMPFDNIIVIVEQDHTYDSYFRSYSSPDAGSVADREGESTPGLFRLADNYVLFDNYFASSTGGTLGNMLDMMTGDTHGLLNSSKESLTALATLEVPTVFDRLNAAGVDWRLYAGDLASIDPAKVADGSYAAPDAAVPASLYRAPVLAMQRTWEDAALSSRVVDQQAFFNDATNGSLPPVSFVLPSPSDHPGQGGTAGETRLLSLINAVQKSNQWGRTAIFVTWDDGGGQFDSGVPPIGSGLRVPMLLVSPYARQGFVSHTEHDHVSLLGLIEARFGLEPLAGRPDPSPSFDDAFEVDHAPRAPMVISRSVLPPTPVGTLEQNRRTIVLYTTGLAVAAAIAAVGLFRHRHRARTATP